MPEAPKSTWHGISRETIRWHPTVIEERCMGCGMCVTSCGKNVYAFDYEINKPVVVSPQTCMVGCTTCATICTRDAIEFPSTGYIRQLIRDRKLLSQAKNLLRVQPEKYDVQLKRE
ncbi:MAG: 4Fe-4S dicluster domain-containing protein [Anaerolineales bacterium]|nr:4Fe-4S dicluster domain-containing protein [Anaerolineales bacterium]